MLAELEWTTGIDDWYGGPEKNTAKEAPTLMDVNNYDFVFSNSTTEKVLWAQTYLIGCGAIAIDINTPELKGAVLRKYIHICNYAPGYNNNQELYEKGKPASNCPANSRPSKNYPSLCAK